MAKGAIAKENVIKKIISALGDDYVGEFDKKLYTWADDGGNKVQISIALSCPKVFRGVEESDSPVLNFDDDDNERTGSEFVPADITQEEQDTLISLMEKLGL